MNKNPVETTPNPSGTEPRMKPASAPFWQQVVWRLMPGTTVGRAIIAARQRLEEADCDIPHLDAQVLLAHVLGVDRTWLFAHHDYELTSAQSEAFTALVTRRMRHEPVAYLIGKREFYGLELLVDRRVLIPRPETELLVDIVIDHLAMRDDQRVTVADIGTGSGAIALAIATNCPSATIVATDLSPQALEVAHQNVRRFDTQGQVTLRQGDLLAPLNKPVDMIVANLPYISSTAYVQLMADVREYEPQLALEGGPEGLDIIRRLLTEAPYYLNPAGLIFLEIGHDQGEAVLQLARTLLPQANSIHLRQDYAVLDRVVIIAL